MPDYKNKLQNSDVDRIQRKCEHCHKWFTPVRSWDRPRYCNNCLTALKICIQCGKPFNSVEPDKLFCSPHCKSYYNKKIKEVI